MESFKADSPKSTYDNPTELISYSDTMEIAEDPFARLPQPYYHWDHPDGSLRDKFYIESKEGRSDEVHKPDSLVEAGSDDLEHTFCAMAIESHKCGFLIFYFKWSRIMTLGCSC